MIAFMSRHPTAKELRALRILTDHPDGLFGLELVRRSGKVISRGSVYFILDRMQQAGWVDSRPEAPPAGYGGKLRNIFTVNAEGRKVLEYEEAYPGAPVST